MALLTEERVRRMSDNGTRGPVVVRREDVLTPSARSWLREHRVEVVYPQGETGREAGAPASPKYRTLFGASLEEKPEHMTHLRGNLLVFKDHPRIAFRGMLDLLEGEIALCQQACVRAGVPAAGRSNSSLVFHYTIFFRKKQGPARRGERYTAGAPGIVWDGVILPDEISGADTAQSQVRRQY